MLVNHENGSVNIVVTQNIVGHVAVEAVVDKQLDLVLAGQLGVALANQKWALGHVTRFRAVIGPHLLELQLEDAGDDEWEAADEAARHYPLQGRRQDPALAWPDSR